MYFASFVTVLQLKSRDSQYLIVCKRKRLWSISEQSWRVCTCVQTFIY